MILISFNASFLISLRRRSPKPVGREDTAAATSAQLRLCRWPLSLESAGQLTLGQCRAAAQDDIREEALAKIEICLVDRVDDHLMDSSVFEAYQLGVEEDLGCAEAFWPELYPGVGRRRG